MKKNKKKVIIIISIIIILLLISIITLVILKNKKKKNDIDITKQISQIGKIHGIFLLDHIIIGDNNYYSFYEDNNL